ncbi:TPA: phage antirepressor KilAC domain-containing protein [Bacillus cereus]|nr:phage antirepressor KilAC domain-containing protein [Bacillus cereus]HDR4742426.1 phage antirepressor KilAC domain-containing protein [Bacillus cereus]HDR4748013.1 phage antirepressor KilAC domain-containing protein [Bacillus cereus]HDR4753487.1 phage antirepressor KilAC domain-containing protein [Bacillus cereus]HDR4770696.1 phage antirepressor KilAC domain-containing protein [Bacillus cereus]
MTNEVMNVEVLVPISEMVFEGRSFSIYGTFEEPLFLAKDVAQWIEYDVSSINKMLRNVDEDEKVRKIVPTQSGAQESWMLTEQGMYEVLLQSRKPVAKECKKVVKAHMKELRVSGVTLRQNLTLQQQTVVLLSKLDEVLIQQEAELAQLNAQIESLGEQTELLEEEIRVVDNQIKELQPYAKKYKEFLSEDALMTIDDFARIMFPRYSLGRNQLFQYMRDNRMLGSEGRNRNMPHRQLVNRNILKLLKGQVFITKQGFDYLCDSLDSHFNL